MRAQTADGHRVLKATIPGPVGPLEALARVPPHAAGAAVVAHPHPLGGGTMHTKVVHRAARLLAERYALVSVRFNFRGVGASAGMHDEGRGEVDDLAAAAAWARALHPEGPFVLAGFSFGSLCAIGAAPRVGPDALLLVGVPLLRWDRSGVEAMPPVPVCWVQGEADEYGGAELARATALRFGWDLRTVASSDHFFTGRLDAFEAAASELLDPLVPPRAGAP